MKFKVEQKFLHTLQGLTNVILLDRDVCLRVPVSAMYIAHVPVHCVSPITMITCRPSNCALSGLLRDSAA